MPRKHKHSRSYDEELEGGFIGALASVGARVGSLAARFVPNLTRISTTAATSAAAATRAAAAAKAATAATAALAKPASLLSRVGARVMPAANVAALGLGIGLPIHQIIQMRQQEAQDARDRAAAAAAQAAADKEALEAQKKADKQFDDNQTAIEEAIKAAKAQQREAELMAEALEKQRQKESDAYTLYITQQDAANKAALEQLTAEQLAELQAQYAAQAPPTTTGYQTQALTPMATPTATRTSKPTKPTKKGWSKKGGAKAIKKLLDDHMDGGCMMLPRRDDPLFRDPRNEIKVPMGLEGIITRKPELDYKQPVICYRPAPVYIEKTVEQPIVYDIPPGEIDRPAPAGLAEFLRRQQEVVLKQPPKAPTRPGPAPPRNTPFTFPSRPPPPPPPLKIRFQAPTVGPKKRTGGAKGAKAISKLLDQYM